MQQNTNSTPVKAIRGQTLNHRPVRYNHSMTIVLLDAGGVVIDGVAINSFAKELSRQTGKPLQEVNSWCTTAVNFISRPGLQDEAWMYEEIAREWGAVDEKALRLSALTVTKPLDNMDAILKELSEVSSLWMLSNYWADWLVGSLKHHKLYGYFDNVFVSSDLGLRKPDTRIFEYVIDKAEGAPIIFVDDKAANTEKAESLGMDVVLADGISSGWWQEVKVFLGSAV